MSLVDFADKNLFGNEAAEDEAENVFSSYAIERPEVTEFLDASSPIAITRAYKGEGKSALLRLVLLNLQRRSPRPIAISVAATSLSPELESHDFDRWVRAWKLSILRLVGNEIGANISLAFGDDAMSLVEEAEQNGFKARSFVSSVVDRLKTSALPLERTRQGVVNPEQTIKRWAQSGSEIWLLIDDLDNNFENTPQQRAKVASAFTACRQIANLIPEFRFRLTVRPNVWATIKQHYETLSHVEQYVKALSWSMSDFYELLSKRVEAHLHRAGRWQQVQRTLSPLQERRRTQLVALAFDDPMPWGRDQRRSPATILYTLSRRRPRWLVELSKHAAAGALKNRRQRINFDDITGVLPDFGQRRVQDTVAEFRSQCPEIEELLTAFVGEPEWFTTADLMSALNNRVLQGVHPKIVGVMGKPSAMEVAHFLFQIGFLTARRDTDGDHYEHLAYADNPALLNARTNVDQGFSWEVHPVFRQVLKLKNVSDRR